MDNNNMQIWNEVSKTDPNYTKEVGYGQRKFTTINAAYQIEQATKLFGPYGSTWGIKSIKNTMITLDRGQIMVLGKAVFFYTHNGQEHSFKLSSTIMLQEWKEKKQALVIESDFAKKLETDILTKALSKLGFAADVFKGRFDDNKYVNELKEEQSNKATKQDVEKLIELAKKYDFERVERGLKYWESGNRSIDPQDKSTILSKVNEYRLQRKIMEDAKREELFTVEQKQDTMPAVEDKQPAIPKRKTIPRKDLHFEPEPDASTIDLF